MCSLVTKAPTLMHARVCVCVCVCVWRHGVNGPESAKHVRNLNVNNVRLEMYIEAFWSKFCS